MARTHGKKATYQHCHNGDCTQCPCLFLPDCESPCPECGHIHGKCHLCRTANTDRQRDRRAKHSKRSPAVSGGHSDSPEASADHERGSRRARSSQGKGQVNRGGTRNHVVPPAYPPDVASDVPPESEAEDVLSDSEPTGESYLSAITRMLRIPPMAGREPDRTNFAAPVQSAPINRPVTSAPKTRARVKPIPQFTFSPSNGMCEYVDWDKEESCHKGIDGNYSYDDGKKRGKICQDHYLFLSEFFPRFTRYRSPNTASYE